MSGNPSEFESTLEELSAARDEVELEWVRRVEELTARTQAAMGAARTAEELAGADPNAGLEAAPVFDAPNLATALPPLPTASSGGGVRGRLCRWLLGEFLGALQEWASEVAGAHAQSQQDVAALRSHAALIDEDRRAAREARVAQYQRTEAIREAVNRMIESVDLFAGVAYKAREMMNAKDAELLHRSTEGPLRRTDVILDELGRQQEALLAELVGKRAELDELVRRATAGGD